MFRTPMPGGPRRRRRGVYVAVLALVFAASCREAARPEGRGPQTWAQVESEARGQTVTWMMWKGDPLINAYVDQFVVPRLRDRHGVTLRTISGQGNRIVSALMTEREAGKNESELDMVWINGESFYQLKQIGALHGPFTDQLPNFSLVDMGNPFIASDFQQPIGGYEAPWGNVQFVLVYNSDRVKEPPRTLPALAAWVKRNPGRFTFDTSFTGMTLLKSWLIALSGGPGALDGPFDETRYVRLSSRLWAYLEDIKPYLWRRGETFPPGVSELHQLFANGEIDFTMSNNDGEVDNKVLQGVLPKSSRGYVFDDGTIQNSHYLGVVAGSRNRSGALVAINFLLSPEAQCEKLKPSVWGDGSVLSTGRLPEEWARKFQEVPRRGFAPDRRDLDAKALRELAPEYMIRLADDFRKHVLP